MADQRLKLWVVLSLMPDLTVATCHPHLIKEEPKAQRGWVTCLSLHSYK